MSGVLVGRLGTAAVTVTLDDAALGLDDVGPITITHGRRDPAEQPQAATCSVTVHAAALADLPQIGSSLTVELGPDGADAFGFAPGDVWAASSRFLGDVTDVTLETSPAGGTVHVTAAGRRAWLGRLRTGASGDYPTELDGPRALRIVVDAELAHPSVTFTAGAFDAGTVTLASRVNEPASALAVLEDVALQSQAALVENRRGELEWHDAYHRAAITVPTVVLDAGDVLDSTVATQRINGLVNDLTLTWSGGAVRLVDSESVESFLGPLYGGINTTIASEIEAEQLAVLVVGRNSVPDWDLASLTVDLLRTVTAAQATALLTLDQGHLLRVENLPAPFPDAVVELWAEGWTETITRHAWRMQLNVSAYERSLPAVTWAEAPGTWISHPSDVSWIDSTRRSAVGL